jgi:branched-chain amino acid transport system permease protein
MTAAQVLQFAFSGLTLGCIYALVALGFTIIFNTTGIVNFAQGDFVMLGAIFSASLSSTFGLPLFAAVLLAVAGVAAVGALMEWSLIRSLREDRSLFIPVMMTMAASIVFNAVALIIWGADPLHLSAFSGEMPLRLLGATLVPQMLWIGGGVAAVMVGLALFFRFTWLGQGMLACAMNRDAAAALGVNVRAMVSLSFICSAAIGGFGGALVAPITMATHDMGGPMTLKGFTAAIIGGLGSVPGALFGGLLLGLFESMSSGIISSGYRDAIALGLLILVLMVKPSGITGVRRVRR